MDYICVIFKDMWSFPIVVSNYFSSSISLDSLGRGSVFPLLNSSNLDDSGVNSAWDAVLHFDIEFRDDVGLKGSVFLEVLLGWGINNVSDGEALDSLVLRAKSATVHANDGLDVSSVVFVSSVVSTLDWHVVNYIEIYLLF